MFTVSIAVVGAADLDDPCGLALFPAYANFLNVYGEINLIDCITRNQLQFIALERLKYFTTSDVRWGAWLVRHCLL